MPVLSGVFGLYFHALRGTPFLVQLYLFYFVLPHSGCSWLSWDSITAAFVALSVYTSSYVAEIVANRPSRRCRADNLRPRRRSA